MYDTNMGAPMSRGSANSLAAGGGTDLLQELIKRQPVNQGGALGNQAGEPRMGFGMPGPRPIVIPDQTPPSAMDSMIPDQTMGGSMRPPMTSQFGYKGGGYLTDMLRRASNNALSGPATATSY